MLVLNAWLRPPVLREIADSFATIKKEKKSAFMNQLNLNIHLALEGK